MANKIRGELEIELCGRKVTLKPEFEGMLAAEDLLGGKPLSSIMESYIQKNTLSLRQITAMIYGGLLWDKDVKGRSLTFDEVGRRVVENGPIKLISAALQMASSTLIPRKEESDQEEPAKKKHGKKDHLSPPETTGTPGTPS